MENFYQIARGIAELLSFLSAPILAFFAWKMLGQLTIGSSQVKAALDQINTSKRISHVQAKREAIKIAAEQSVFYAEKILPEMEKFMKLQKGNKYPILSRAEIIENLPDIQCKTDDLPGLIKEIHSNNGLVLKTLNQLEGFAMYFVCGIADSDSAYRPICSTFCSYIKLFLPYLVIANDHYRQFSNVLGLYVAWASRDQAERAAKEIEKHKEHLSKIKVPEMNPYGTEKNC